MVEVVARHAPRNVRVFRTDQVRVAIPNLAQRAVNFAAASSHGDDGIEFVRAGGPHGQLRSVIEEDFQFVNVIGRLSGEQGMSAARVVADHAAQGATVVRGRIGSPCELMSFCGIAQRIADDTRLNPCVPLGGIQSPRTSVEPHFTADDTPQFEFKFSCGPERIHRLRMRTRRQRGQAVNNFNHLVCCFKNAIALGHASAVASPLAPRF